MNNRQRQIYKVARKRIRAGHNTMMKELFDFIFAELDDEMEEKENDEV